MAESFPMSHFVGIELTNYKLKPSEFPDNCTFPRCSIVELPLPFDDSSFDYVFMRYSLSSVPSDCFSNILIELKRVLKPGGYLEWNEPDSLFRGGPLVTQFMSEGKHQ
ncbi:hypothetical protein BC937DRAFT_87452 [Endogone sp. FLAS-F59071]|nr:hypothetical protein BC937DRAFT_87452 [Endogone sp. FLAS-F59071]|eukprot:RUS12597.1 hypothetical protein BC937DRAFT_87452 [Endogone sp. FLAS-F59071]